MAPAIVGKIRYGMEGIPNDFLSSIPSTKRENSGRTWILSIITIIWKHMHNNWTARNDARHGVDSATREAVKYKQAITETKSLYALRRKVQPRDQDLFYTNIDEHMLKEPTSTGLRQWLNTWKSVLLQSMKDGDRTGSNQIQPLTRFYPRQQPHQDSTTTNNTITQGTRIRQVQTPIPTSSVTRAINSAIATLLRS